LKRICEKKNQEIHFCCDHLMITLGGILRVAEEGEEMGNFDVIWAENIRDYNHVVDENASVLSTLVVADHNF
jgi:hypothetical protein